MKIEIDENEVFLLCVALSIVVIVSAILFRGWHESTLEHEQRMATNSPAMNLK